MRKILLLLITILILTGCSNKEVKKEKQIIETNGMLSYTIDGEKTDIKPTKEDGYIVNKIICDNGSDMMWDNDNWEVELTKINSKDRCKIDFTKDTSKEGYRVTVTSNIPSSLDSLSKATIENGTVIIYSKSKIESVTGCNGIIEDNKVIVSNITLNQACNIEVDKTLAGMVKVAYNVDDNRKRTNFSVIDNGTHIDTPSGLTGGLYAAEDDQGITYYFSGDGSGMNNWVKFADKWWRIIRINGNGSVRLLYAGDGGKDGYLIDVGPTTYSIDSTTYAHPAYVGWKYTNSSTLSDNKKNTLEGDRENSTPSGAYSKVESWYTSNVKNKGLTKYIDTNAIYCNDRNLASGSTYSTRSEFYYAPYTRLYTNKEPVFICSNASDKFTTFGLMTADEVVFAGGVYEVANDKAYYYLAADGKDSITGSARWWTMSPYGFLQASGSSRFSNVFSVFGYLQHGYLGNIRTAESAVVRPVISLKKEVQVTGGDGSATSPYEVTLP